MMRRWGQSVGVAVAALVVGGVLAASGSVVAGVVLFVLLAAIAVASSPRAFPRSVTDAEARARSAADGRPIVYWRPGCPFCMRLRAATAREADQLHWVDIWADPEGAASVRAVADGNETVPTVITPTEAMVNPSPDRVRALVRS